MDLYRDYRNTGKNNGRSDVPSIDEYLSMTEEEKDLAIQNAIIRLQTRIQEILYLLESGMKKKENS